jgi:hypothetical protein
MARIAMANHWLERFDACHIPRDCRMCCHDRSTGQSSRAASDPFLSPSPAYYVRFVSQIPLFDEAGLATVAQCISQRLPQPEAFKSQVPQHSAAKQRSRLAPNVLIGLVTVDSASVFNVKHSVTRSTRVCCGLVCAGRSAFVCS